MAAHYLYLTNACIVSLVARGGRLAERKVFPVSTAGREGFERHVRGLRALPTHILTDLSEEDFRLDTIPHLRQGDREAVVGRRLNQLFRNSPYRHAILQGRETEGRRDDRVVYTAITNTEVLRTWQEILERLEVPVEGIYSSAVFSGRLLTDLKLAFAHALLVTFTPGGAIRETYFRDKEIKFSRLTPVDLEEGDSLGGLIAGETARTWQYLDSLRYFSPEDRLEVCVLVHPKDRPAIEPLLRDFDQIHFHLLDIEQVAAKLGLKPPPLTSSAEEVLVHLLQRASIDNHFASPELRRFAVLRRARIAINAIAGGVLAAGLAWGGWNTYVFMKNQSEAAQTNVRIEALKREYEEIIASTPSVGVGGEAMRDTVSFYNGTLRSYPTMGPFLVPVSRVLDGHPRVRLTQFAWQATDDEQATPSITATAPRNPTAVKSTVKTPAGGAPAGTKAASSGEAPFSSGRLAVALFEATVQVDGVGFRAALDEVARLVAEINRIEGFRAEVVDSPLDTKPAVALQGQFHERNLPSAEARFTFRVVRAAGPRT